MEIWKDIKGYEGLYQVSNQGKVKSLSREMFNGSGYFNSKQKILNLNISTNGYLTVVLCKYSNINKFRVHRLVYQSFKGELIKYRIIDHIDNNKLNNNIINLQQISQRLNVIKYKSIKVSSSIYTGVSWNKLRCLWESAIEVNGKTIRLGHYEVEQDAAKAYNLKLKELINKKDYLIARNKIIT